MKKSLALMLCCIGLISCGSSGSSHQATTSSSLASSLQASSTLQSAESSSSADTGNQSSASNSSTSESSANGNPGFSGDNTRLIGRFDVSQTGRAQFTWPGSALEFQFEGTHADLDIGSQARARFEVDINGNRQTLWINPGDHHYTLASGLPQGRHTIRLTRLSESAAGITTLLSDPRTDGHFLAAPEAPARRLLVIGDSITAGYGVEGSSYACGYSLDTSSQQLTYAALAARDLGADLHAIAWSGIGAWRSYGEVTPISPTILTRYERTLADTADSVWDTSQYQPHATLINIGTNDYWQGSASDDYRLGMARLIDRVQNDYPQKPVYLIVSPMLSSEARSAQASVLNSLTSTHVKVLDLGAMQTSDGFGCDYHPNLVTQTRLGQQLRDRLSADLGW